MLKLLLILPLLNSLLLAASSDEKVASFIEESFKSNPKIKSLNIKIVDKISLEKPKGWQAYIVSLNATLKKDNRKITQKMIWFESDGVITQELIDIETGESLKGLVTPSFKDEYYKDENLIYGNKNAKHKVAIFSDPLCPFCREFIPKAIKEMKKYPKKFAVYYYHFPLPSLHPAAVELSLAALAAEKKGEKNVVLRLYEVEVNPRERDLNKILDAFNESFNTDITPSDLKSSDVLKHYAADQKIADEVMVQGTPTMFFDGKMDKTKNKFKEVK